ncbi:hypothetical protein A7U60_g3821 [Sanghuangporus baumii]|uniref:Methyltransferase domain-containing protein n=1 Tax=Sanghuangporus baumii TaxID=108892 RepID=A0A9Q5NCU4_SANBA|nr:hypothetical protein A7U60_g3821 [Sanghuangporus baumii]
MTRLSLSGEILPDHEEDSSQGATDFVSNLGSTPPSPTSDSVTSFDFEENSISDHLSSLSPQPSLYSLTESLKEQVVRFEYGRTVNTHSDVYKLAADEEEAQRLDQQHRLYQVVFGDYVPPFREVLGDNDDPLRLKACLDIGCGSGAWILEVANAFPHVSCLEHFAGDFDVVHAQHISSGIKDYYRLIDDVALALRPHGLAEFTENDWRLYDINKRPVISTTSEIWGTIEPPEGWTGRGLARSGTSPARRVPKGRASSPSPYLARFTTLVRQAALRRGAHVDAAALLNRWISEHPAYEDVIYREAWLPLGGWLDSVDVRNCPGLNSTTPEEFDRLCRIGRESAEDFLAFMRSARPLLLSTGVPEMVADQLTIKASQELRETRIPLYIRSQKVYARKKERRQDAAALLLS